MSEQNPEQLNHSPQPEQAGVMPDIPKSREIFTGDINDAVIQAQVQTGVEIDDGFWFSQVGNDGSTESILDRFDTAYPDFVRDKLHIPEKLEGREESIASVGVLAVETTQAREDEGSSSQEKTYDSELLTGYALLAEDSREKGKDVNKKIADVLTAEAEELLAQGLSGNEVAERLGIAKVVSQRSARLLYDMGKDLPGREVPLEEPAQPWDGDEYIIAKNSVIASMQEKLVERNEMYQQLTSGLLENDLNYRDVLGDEAIRAGSNSEHPEHATAYAHELARLTIAGRGKDIQKAAQDIREHFDKTTVLLPESLRMSPYAESQSWILWDIGKQEALKDNDYRSTIDEEVSYSGSVLDNPEQAGSEQSEFMKNVIAWRHLGWEMHLKAFNGEDVGSLDSMLDEQTKSMLHKVGDEAHSGQLSSSEYTDLGRGIESALRSQEAKRFIQERPELQTELRNRSQQMLEMYSNNMESTALLGEVSKPETRRYTSDEKYRFLVHTVLDDPRGTYGYLSGSQPNGFRIEADKPLNASLIDQRHTATFEGVSGLIIKPPEMAADVTGIWSGDVAVDMQTKGKPTMTGIEALAATNKGEYNQVHLKAGKVEGVFIRIAADSGQELGYPQTNQALRELAAEQGLPVAEIMVDPRDIREANPVMKEPIPTGNGELYQIVVPHNGYEYKIDVVKQDGSGVSFADSEGFAMRMAKVDNYDVWDRNLTRDDIDSIQDSLTALGQSNPEIVQYIQRQVAELQSRGNST